MLHLEISDVLQETSFYKALQDARGYVILIGFSKHNLLVYNSTVTVVDARGITWTRIWW